MESRGRSWASCTFVENEPRVKKIANARDTEEGGERNRERREIGAACNPIPWSSHDRARAPWELGGTSLRASDLDRGNDAPFTVFTTKLQNRKRSRSLSLPSASAPSERLCANSMVLVSDALDLVYHNRHPPDTCLSDVFLLQDSRCCGSCCED